MRSLAEIDAGSTPRSGVRRSLEEIDAAPAALPASDPFGRDTQVVNPMGQSLSPIPEGQSVLPAQYSSSAPDMAGQSPSWEKDGGKFIKKPTFLTSVEGILSGAMQGSLTFSANLLSLAEKGLRGGGKPSIVNDAFKAWEDKNKAYQAEYPESNAVGIGKAIPELLQTSVLSGPMGKVAQGAKAVGNALWTGLKTAGEYGTAAAGTTGLLAAMESQRHDPNKPDQILNLDAAKSTLEDPAAYALGAAGQKVSKWMGASRVLEAAKEVDPYAMARQVKPATASRNFENMVFDSVGALTGAGKGVQQMGAMGDTLYKYVSNTIAQIPNTMNAKELKNYSAQHIQLAMKKLKLGEQEIWDKVPRSSPIQDKTGVIENVAQAKEILASSGIPLESKKINYLDNIIKKPDLTVEDVKELQSIVGGASVSARKMVNTGGTGQKMASELDSIKENLLNHIQGSLNSTDMKAFSAARKYSADFFELKAAEPKLTGAMVHEKNARNLVGALTRESETVNKAAVKGMLPKQGQRAVAATKVAEAVKASDTEGHFNLQTFLDKTNAESHVKEAMDPATYKAFEGTRDYLSAVNAGSKVGWWRPASLIGMGAAVTGAGALVGGAPAVGAILASYAAATLIANHSPLKTVLSAMTKHLPDSTYKHLMGVVEKHFARAGYIIKDGVLQHEDE